MIEIDKKEMHERAINNVRKKIENWDNQESYRITMKSFVSCDQTPTDHASDMPPLYSFSERLSHAN